MNLQAAWSTYFGLNLVLTEAREALPLAHLTPGERTILQTMSEVREASWLLGRAALHALLPRLGREKDSSLLRFPEAQVSLTHTTTVALAIGTNDLTLGLGIDAEDDRTVKRSSLRFFASEAEQAKVRTDADALRLWTIKEALFKADADNAAEALFNYRLIDPGATEGYAVSSTRDGRRFRYSSHRTSTGFTTLALRVS